MFKIHREEIEWAGRPLVLETGKMARQADGAVLVRYGDTTVLATVVASPEPARFRVAISSARAVRPRRRRSSPA